MRVPVRLRSLLQGDLVPRKSDFGDVRNDNASSGDLGLQSGILRYLENLPLYDMVTAAVLTEELGRRHPFHGVRESAVVAALEALKEDGWVRIRGPLVQIDKVAAVARRRVLGDMVTERLARRWMSKRVRVAQALQPLYGHTSPETAYLVDDYPYGFRLRTQIRYWLEFNPKRGFRFVSQTLDPKRPGQNHWNKPKPSTYSLLAGNMAVDGQGHVTWKSLTEYSDAKEVAAFIQEFPRSDFSILKRFAKGKVKYLEDAISGRAVWRVNGVPKPLTDQERGEHREELEIWQRVALLP